MFPTFFFFFFFFYQYFILISLLVGLHQMVRRDSIQVKKIDVCYKAAATIVLVTVSDPFDINTCATVQ